MIRGMPAKDLILIMTDACTLLFQANLSRTLYYVSYHILILNRRSLWISSCLRHVTEVELSYIERPVNILQVWMTIRSLYWSPLNWLSCHHPHLIQSTTCAWGRESTCQTLHSLPKPRQSQWYISEQAHELDESASWSIWAHILNHDMGDVGRSGFVMHFLRWT